MRKLFIGWSLLLCVVYAACIQAIFEGCDFVYNLRLGYKFDWPLPDLWPQGYAPGSSCRNTFKAPKGYYISYDCNLEMGRRGFEEEDLFIIQKDGTESELIGTQHISSVTKGSQLTMAYISKGNAGKFKCEIRPQCDCGWSLTRKIVRGSEAQLNEYPSVVALMQKIDSRQMRFFSGGTIINMRFIITAAHCLNHKSSSDIIILAGQLRLTDSLSPRSSQYGVNAIIRHHNYQGGNRYDIALLETDRDMQWTLAIGPICFSPSNNGISYNFVDIVGWGLTSFGGYLSNTLLKAKTLVTDDETCQRYYPNSEKEFCTYLNGTDACQYDSGGPVLSRNSPFKSILGIISYGTYCGIKPGVNTRINTYIDWINSHIGVYPICVK